MCPRMVVKGFDTARTIRSVWVVGSSPKRLWTRHDEVEAGQDIIRIVKRAVFENIRLDPLQDSEAISVPGVQCVRELVLFRDPLA
jgi:hypothetical protein